MSQDSLQYIPIERWPDLQSAFLSDWPRGIPGYNVLETQIRWNKEGFDHGIKVYCPYGDVRNGFVGVIEKALSYDIIIQYPNDDTEILEEALRTTKVIDWDKKITIPFAAFHVITCIKKVIEAKQVEMINIIPSDTFILEKDAPLFKDVNLPPGFTMNLLSSEHVDLIDSKWPHRYPTSSWFFQLLIDTKSGYGLFKDGELTSWIFISECGHLTHLYTLEEHRNQGLAELMLKLISNELLKKKIEVYAFCVKGNEKAFKLYKKIGFTKTVDIAWCFLAKKCT